MSDVDRCAACGRESAQRVRADERARFVAILRNMLVATPGRDLVTEGWNRALRDAIKAIESSAS